MSDILHFAGGDSPDDLRSLDEELSSISYEERPSFVPELRAELARAWEEEPARRRAAARRHLTAAALVALLLGGAAVPSARASLIRLISVLGPEATVEEAPVGDLTQPPVETPGPGSGATRSEDAVPPAPVAETPAEVALPEVVPGTPGVHGERSWTVPRMLDRVQAAAMLRDAYPETLQLRGIGGTVRLRLWVDESGATSQPSVSRSSGVPELDRVAVEITPRFHFVPALQAGRPRGTWIEFPVLFEPDPARAGRVLDPVVDPLSMPTVDRSEWWQLSQPLDLASLSATAWREAPAPEELATAERSLLSALSDPSLIDQYGPASAILAGVAPASVEPTEWRVAVGAALGAAIERGTETPSSLLALGRIRMRQGVRAEARRLFEVGLQMALREPESAGVWVVAELHYERGTLVRDNWRSSDGVGRVRSDAFASATCATARSSGEAGSGFASVERLMAWNYLCPREMERVFELGFEPHEPGRAADLTLMMASYRAAIEAYPAHVGANTDFLTTLAAEGRWEQVLRGARRFTRVSRGHPQGLLLAGMALHRLGRSAEAAATFRAALDRMDVAEAEELVDVGVLLSPDERSRYRRLPVEERRAWERDFWANKDPVASTEVNERWVEHLARTSYAYLSLGGVFGDAGEVWIRFGGPETVHIVDGGSGRLTEFWDYGSGPDITFVRWVSSERTDLTPEGRAYVDDLGRVFSP